MSQRGMEFLQKWIKNNVDPHAFPPLYDTRAKVFGEQCAADARKEGISVEEIEVEIGDLTECMFKAMNEKSGAAG